MKAYHFLPVVPYRGRYVGEDQATLPGSREINLQSWITRQPEVPKCKCCQLVCFLEERDEDRDMRLEKNTRYLMMAKRVEFCNQRLKAGLDMPCEGSLNFERPRRDPSLYGLQDIPPVIVNKGGAEEQRELASSRTDETMELIYSIVREAPAPISTVEISTRANLKNFSRAIYVLSKLIADGRVYKAPLSTILIGYWHQPFQAFAPYIPAGKEDLYAHILSLYRAGKTCHCIAVTTGCNDSTVRSALMRMGIAPDFGLEEA